jgi:hypothetical protein
MNARTASRVAWSLWLLVAIGIAFGLFLRPEGNVELEDVPLLVSFGAFATVGAVVASRRPQNPLGWIFLAIGLLTAIAAVAEAYAARVPDRSGPVPAPVALGAWIQNWFWYPLVAMSTLLTMLLFPSGLPSRRWRPVLWSCVAAAAAVTVMAALSPTVQAAGREVPNPLGVTGLNVRDVEETLLFQVFTILLFGGIAAAVISLVGRFRRSRGTERQQLKWFMYAAILVVANIIASVAFPAYERSEASGFVFGLLIGLVPVSCGLAILRYRLYDIDLIINRTLVYGALTAVLALVYVGGVVGVGGLVREATGQQDNSLVIAATTLVVAALFRPARARIQAFIDRRFYRRKYDAARTVEAFSARLRDEVDLETMRLDLVTVVHDTMGPARASLWLRS